MLIGSPVPPPPDVFSPADTENATQQTIQQLLERLNLPTDPAALEELLGEAVLEEDLNALLAALERNDIQPEYSALEEETQRSTHEPIGNQNEQVNDEITQKEEVVASHATEGQIMEDDSKLEASAEELAGVAQQLPDTETNLHNGEAELDILSCRRFFWGWPGC